MTYTNHGGRFVFDGVVDTKVILVVGADAHGQTEVEVAGDKLKAPLTIQLRAGKQIAGQVLDPAGKPVPGAWVTLYKSGGIGAHEAAGPSTSTTSLCVLADADGKFRFTGLDGQTNWQVITTFIQDGVRHYGEVYTTGGKANLVVRAAVSQ